MGWFTTIWITNQCKFSTFCSLKLNRISWSITIYLTYSFCLFKYHRSKTSLKWNWLNSILKWRLIKILSIRNYHFKFTPLLIINKSCMNCWSTYISFILIHQSSNCISKLTSTISRTIYSKFLTSWSFKKIITSFYTAFYFNCHLILICSICIIAYFFWNTFHNINSRSIIRLSNLSFMWTSRCILLSRFWRT